MSNKKKRAKGKYTVSLIGCGRIGFTRDGGKKSDYPLTHFSCFFHDDHFEIVAVAEPLKEVRDKIERDFKVKTYENANKLLADENSDIYIVSTPDYNHFEILKKIIKKKPKLVLSEKPISLPNQNEMEIISSYKLEGIPLIVNYTRRFIPEYSMIKKELTKNYFGKLQCATIYYSRGLFHNGSHYADLILWFFGWPKKIIKIQTRPNDMDNTENIVMIYPNGFELHLQGIETSPLTINEIDIVGTKKRIRLDTDGVIYEWKVKPKKASDDFIFFGKAKIKKLSINSALKNLKKNIFDYLCKDHPLISPASNDIENFKLLRNIREHE